MPLALPFLRPKRRVKDPDDDERTARSAAATLAPELLLKILQYLVEPNLRHLPPRKHRRTLHSVPLVCRHWNGPGTEALYKRVYLLSHDTAKLMRRTLKRRSEYGSLIHGICFCPPPPIAVILDGKLTKLSLWNIGVVHPSTNPKGTVHGDVLLRCPRITELCIETNAVNDVQLRYEFPITLGWSPTNTLRILSVRGDYSGPYPSSFVHLLKALAHSSASRIEDLTIHSYQFRDRDPPQCWEGRLPPLLRLRITQCHIAPEMFSLLAHACARTLRVVEIIDCQALSRAANFTSILASLTGLRKLSIGRGLPFGADMAGLVGLKVLSLDDYVCSHADFIGSYPPNIEEIRVHIWWGPESGSTLAAEYIRKCSRLAHLKRVQLRVYSLFADIERWRIMAVCLAGIFPALRVSTRLMIVREDEDEDDPEGAKMPQPSTSRGLRRLLPRR